MTSKKLVYSVALSVGMLLAVGGSAFAGDYCPPDTTKGNNGWGQEKHGGTDGTNPGSTHGATADSKTASTER